MTKTVVGIGDISVSKDKDETIITYALGSCIAVILLDPGSRVGGMVHVALPDSATDLDKAKTLPGYFADTGIDEMISQMQALGAGKTSSMIAKLIGGASIMKSNDIFQVGKRNAVAIKKILWQKDIRIKSEDIGDFISRTVRLDMKNGKAIITSHSFEGERKI